MLSVIKWIAYLPLYFLSILAAYILAPIAVLFRHGYSLEGTCFWWITTPNTDLRGDPAHQERWNYANSYPQFVTWIWRNPAVNFQREYLGVSVDSDDEYHQHHKHLPLGGEYKREYLERNGRIIAWMIYVLIPWCFYPKKGFRLLIGWKCWDVGYKSPLQYACRFTLWKSV